MIIVRSAVEFKRVVLYLSGKKAREMLAGLVGCEAARLEVIGNRVP